MGGAEQLAVASAGAIVVARASTCGLVQLGLERPHPSRVAAASTVAGAGAGLAAVSATASAGSWWWLPALLVWAFGVAACGVCDWFTQRIPATLVWEAGITFGFLSMVAVVATGDWPAGLLSAVGLLVAALLMAALWRFGGAGFGDVRLAALGGVGLGHASATGLLYGCLAFASLTLLQGIWTLVRTKDRKAMLPYGPPLALGFLVAAALSAA